MNDVRVVLVGSGCQASKASVPQRGWQMRLKYQSSRQSSFLMQVYILWMNLIVQILLPFVLLFVLNLQIYRKIKNFEQTLTQMRVCFTTNSSTNQRVESGQQVTTTITFFLYSSTAAHLNPIIWVRSPDGTARIISFLLCHVSQSCTRLGPSKDALPTELSHRGNNFNYIRDSFYEVILILSVTSVSYNTQAQ